MERKAHIAPLGNPCRIGAGLRCKGKQIIHFLRAFHIKLAALITHPVLIQNRFPRLDAKQNIMRLCVLFINIMAVICANQRNPCFSAHPHQRLIHNFLLPNPMILQFQKVIALPENIEIFQRDLLRLLIGYIQNISGYLPCQTCARCNDALAVFPQKLLIHTRLIIKPFGKAIGNQLNQIMVALIIFSQKNQMIITAALALLCEARALRHINLTAENRLDAGLQCRLVKFHRTIHRTVVGDGNAVHPQLLHPLHQFLYLGRAVQKAVFRMNMKMRKRFLLPFSFLHFQFPHLLCFLKISFPIVSVYHIFPFRKTTQTEKIPFFQHRK